MEQNKPIMQYKPVGDETPQDERIFATLEKILMAQDEQEKGVGHGYIHDHAEFMESLDHVVNDQLSAIRQDKISISELTTRINRWFAFCDAVANLGVSCIYNQRFAANNDYEKLFTGLRVNASFNSMYLKPRGIVVEFRHKSKEAQEQYPWLAMPCLVIKGNDDIEHEIAITPTTNAAVWWLDILTDFHATFNWEPEAIRIVPDEEGNMVVDLSHDHEVNSPFDVDGDEDEMPPVDATYGIDLNTTLTTMPETTEDGQYISKDELPVTPEEEEAFKAIPETAIPQRKYDHTIHRDADGKFTGMSVFPIPTEEEKARFKDVEIKGVVLKSSTDLKMKPEYEYNHSKHVIDTSKKHYFALNPQPESKGFMAWLNKVTLKVIKLLSRIK